MDQQTYEITAPNGKVLSITGDHVPTERELHDIFAKAGVATGATQPDPHQPHISAAPDDRPVTLGDLREDPAKAIARIGTILKKDASDPKLWLGLAAGYFAPKIFNAAGPIVARAANATASTVGRVSIDPSVAMEEFSLMKPQKMLKAVSLKEQPVADRVPGFDRYMPNASGARAPALDRTGAPIDLRGAASTLFRGEPPAPAATSPVAAVPASTAAPAVDTPPPPPATAPKFPIQKALNELAIQARRQGVKLSETESQAGVDLMRDHGASAEDVVKTVAASRSPSGLTLSAEEQALSASLRTAGKSGAEVESAILKARALAKKLKTPATGAVEDAVQRRNETGRWDE